MILLLNGHFGPNGWVLNLLKNITVGEGPKIVYWALDLSENMDRFEDEEQIIIKRSQLKSQRQGTSERLSEEEI